MKKYSFAVCSDNIDDAWEKISIEIEGIDNQKRLVMEEVIANVYMHSVKSAKEIRILIEVNRNIVSISISNVKNFNFLSLLEKCKDKKFNYDLNSIGGFGLILIDNIVKNKKYYHDGCFQHYIFEFYEDIC